MEIWSPALLFPMERACNNGWSLPCSHGVTSFSFPFCQLLLLYSYGQSLHCPFRSFYDLKSTIVFCLFVFYYFLIVSLHCNWRKLACEIFRRWQSWLRNSQWPTSEHPCAVPRKLIRGHVIYLSASIDPEDWTRSGLSLSSQWAWPLRQSCSCRKLPRVSMSLSKWISPSLEQLFLVRPCF